MKIINKYIKKNFKVIDTYNAGVVLKGPEVKSCKNKRVNFKGAYCGFGQNAKWEKQGRHLSLFLKNLYIAPYVPAKREQRNYDPYRARKLLLNAKEINALYGKLRQKGMTLIPFCLFTERGFIKCELALVQGLKKRDKREKLKEEEFERRKCRLVQK